MLTLIFLSIASVILIVVAVLINKYGSWDSDWLAGLFAFFGGCCVVVLIGCLISLINIDRKFNERIVQYETIVQMVDSYDGQDYGNMGSLVEAVVGMNKRIAKHKAYYDSPWNGLWYSVTVAELEPIRFDKKTGLTE